MKLEDKISADYKNIGEVAKQLGLIDKKTKIWNKN